MIDKSRIKADATHFPNLEERVAQDSKTSVLNHQSPQLLISPEEDLGGPTHSQKPVLASEGAIHDPQSREGRFTHLNNVEDPAADYLPVSRGLPLIDNTEVAADSDELLDSEFGEDVDSEFDEDTEVFEAPAAAPAGEMEVQEPVEEPPVGEMEPLEPETTEGPNSALALLDVDGVPDRDDTELQFATIANVVHVIRANRIIASMTRAAAIRARASEVYLTQNYQEVVADTVSRVGLRRGLVGSGFALARVANTANKTQAAVIRAQVAAATAVAEAKTRESQAAMVQCMAIASVGINRRYFADVPNRLRAGFETELQRLGVRGGSNIVRSMFAQYGVDYARDLVALAAKLADKPESIRNQYAEALDMIADETAEDEEIEPVTGSDEEDFDELPTNLSAALSNPVRRSRSVLLGTLNNQARNILSGRGSLI